MMRVFIPDIAYLESVLARWLVCQTYKAYCELVSTRVQLTRMTKLKYTFSKCGFWYIQI